MLTPLRPTVRWAPNLSIEIENAAWHLLKRLHLCLVLRILVCHVGGPTSLAAAAQHGMPSFAADAKTALECREVILISTTNDFPSDVGLIPNTEFRKIKGLSLVARESLVARPNNALLLSG